MHQAWLVCWSNDDRFAERRQMLESNNNKNNVERVTFETHAQHIFIMANDITSKRILLC